MDRLLQNLLRQNGFYMLNKVLIAEFGLVEAAVLALLIDQHAMYGDDFYVTEATAQEALNIGRKPFDRAIATLKDKGVVTTELKGMPARTFYNINYSLLVNVLSEGQTRLSKTDKQDCPKRTTIKNITIRTNNPQLSKDNIPQGGESVMVEEVSDDELVFDTFRKAYKGTKRGLNTEFTNFKKKHKDWREVLPLLLPAYQHQQELREQGKATGCFVPQEKNLQTYINQRCWEEEPHFEQDTSKRNVNIQTNLTPEGMARQRRTDEFVEALFNS